MEWLEADSNKRLLITTELTPDQLLSSDHHGGVQNTMGSTRRMSLETPNTRLRYTSGDNDSAVVDDEFDFDECDNDLANLISLNDGENIEESFLEEIDSIHEDLNGGHIPTEVGSGLTTSLQNFGGDGAGEATMSTMFSEDEFEVKKGHKQSDSHTTTGEVLELDPSYVVEDDEGEEDIIDTVPTTDGPIPHPAWSVTESLMAQLMSKLSMKEREEVYHDIHGVQDVIDEDAEDGFLDRNFAEMEHGLQCLAVTEKEAYEMALLKSPDYVNNRDFRLRFLRASRFDPKHAALRYARHYQRKLELFGADKLGRDIVQDDLGSEALEALYCGMSQTLPRRDTAGRLLWLWVPGSKQQSFSKEAVLRRMFYNMTVLSEDVETQKKGVVGIFYSLNQDQTRRGSEGRDNVRSIANMALALPVSMPGVHFCYNNYAFLPILSIAQLAVHLFVRLRIRAHYGTHAECIYKLQTFGIPADTIPIDEKGNVQVDNHRRVLEKRRVQERQWAEQQSSASGAGRNTSRSPINILVPSRYDVLLGRGKGYFNHVGNVRYRGLIEDLTSQYDKAPRDGKQKLAKEVVGVVRELGGRFLKDDGGVWIPIDDEAARLKVGHSFRALRSSSQKQSKTGGKAAGGERNIQTNQRPSADLSSDVPTMKRMKRG